MKRLLSFVVLLLLVTVMFAVPANRRPFVVKQSDGTMLSLLLGGDEALHFHMTLDNKYVLKGENGDYFYATFSQEGEFVSTGVLAHNAGNRSSEEETFLSTIDYDILKKNISKKHASLSAKYRNLPATRAASIVAQGEVLVPVLLVQYSDVKFSYTKKDIDRLLNEEGYKYSFMNYITSHGSARDYFIAQSGGKFTPKFVVTDIVTLSQPMAYYGGNSSGDGGSDKNPQAMIREGLEKSDAKMDYSQFDNDGDGNVEFIYCIYAGYSEAVGADANTIWPHQWALSANGGIKNIDGVNCNIYACSSELYLNETYEADYGKWLAGIGTICHEFSHCLGLHDVYDVTYESGNWGMDVWDLMDQGNYAGDGYIPVGYNSYQKDVCGWQELEVLEYKGSYSMKPQSQGGVGYKIVNEANPNEYFILENRKREGWDQTLYADGMMIMHVDYDADAWSQNKINTTPGHPRFQLVPADNDLSVFGDVDREAFYESLAKDLWPGPADNTEFTNTSIPAAKVYVGEFLNKPVTDIKYDDGIVSFTFMGGTVATPMVEPATEITSGSFVANWAVVDDASEYIVELYRFADAADGNGDVKELLKEDFMKCYKSATLITQTLDDYMSVPGWTGTNVYSENGMLRLGSMIRSGSLETPLMNASGEIVVTVDVNKYNTADSKPKAVVEVLLDSGNVIASKMAIMEGTVELQCNVDGGFYVRVSTDSEAAVKRVLIDNLSVSAVLPYRMEFVESVTVADNCHEFNGLEQGKYAYRVKGVDGDIESEFSDYEEVELSATSAVEIMEADNGYVKVYTLSGFMVYNGKREAMPDLPCGIYVTKDGNIAKKIFVR